MEKNQVIILNDRGFIQAKGPEAEDFLQNIITNDIKKVNNNSAIFSSILTPQGKYLFEFFVLKTKEGYLALSEIYSDGCYSEPDNYIGGESYEQVMDLLRLILDDLEDPKIIEEIE